MTCRNLSASRGLHLHSDHVPVDWPVSLRQGALPFLTAAWRGNTERLCIPKMEDTLSDNLEKKHQQQRALVEAHRYRRVIAPCEFRGPSVHVQTSCSRIYAKCYSKVPSCPLQQVLEPSTILVPSTVQADRYVELRSSSSTHNKGLSSNMT
jgi:hypothetical protein